MSMTNEEMKELLIALCGYYPHGVICHVTDINDLGYSRNGKLKAIKPTLGDCKGLPYLFDVEGCSVLSDICEVKPYLRSLNDMTGREKVMFEEITGYYSCGHEFYYDKIKNSLKSGSKLDFKVIGQLTNWLDSHFFDYRNMIGREMALETKITESLYSENLYYENFDRKVKFIDLGLPSGTLWGDRNLGAENPVQYGHYFRWGETIPYTEKSPRYDLWILDNNIVGTEYDASTALFDKGCNMPTHEQFKELMEFCTSKFHIRSGVKGFKVTGPNGKSIFIPAAGRRYDTSDALLNGGKKYAYLWSSSIKDEGKCARCIYINPDGIHQDYLYRGLGLSVRSVKNK